MFGWVGELMGWMGWMGWMVGVCVGLLVADQASGRAAAAPPHRMVES